MKYTSFLIVLLLSTQVLADGPGDNPGDPAPGPRRGVGRRGPTAADEMVGRTQPSGGISILGQVLNPLMVHVSQAGNAFAQTAANDNQDTIDARIRAPMENSNLISAEAANAGVAAGVTNNLPPQEILECEKVDAQLNGYCTVSPFALPEGQADQNIDQLSLIMNYRPDYVPQEFKSRCQCIGKKLSSMPQINGHEDELKKKIVEGIRQKLSEKVTDEYASLLEGFHFFSTTNMDILAKGSKLSNLGRQLCTFDKFEAQLRNNPTCKGNPNMSEKVEKLMGVFSSLGADLNPNLPNDQKFRRLNTDILGANQGYSRRQFDLDRYTLQNDKDIVQADKLLTAIFRDDHLMGKIQETMFEGENFKSPVVIMGEMFSRNLIDKRTDELSKVFTPELLGQDLYQKYLDLNRIQGKDDRIKATFTFMQSFSPIFMKAVSINPGIEQVLSNRSLFYKVKDKLNKNNSVLEVVNSDKDLMKDHFNLFCDDLTEKVARTVCISDDDLLKGLNSRTVTLYNNINKKEGPEALYAYGLSCQNNLDDTSSDLLEGLAVDPRMWKTSDYLARSKNLPSIYSALKKKSEDKDFRAQMDGYNQIYQPPRSSYLAENGSDFDIFGREVAPKGNNFSSAATTDKKAEANQNSQNYSNSGSSTEFRDSSVFDNNLYSSNMSSANLSGADSSSLASTQKTDKEKHIEDLREDYRREFREYMANKGMSDQQINQIVSNSNDEMMKRLMDLQQEMEKNQKKIQDLTSENQKMKLAQMQERLNSLERERAALDSGDVPPKAERRTAGGSRTDSYLQPSVSRRPASIAPQDVGGSNAGASATGGSSGSDSQAGVAGLNRALLSGNNALATRSGSGDSNPVVVAAPSAKSGTIEIKSQEVGLDLLNYLSSSGTDIQTLINLKTSGIIYKYKVMEEGKVVEKEVLIEYNNLNEDVKKIIDKKIAQNKDRSKEVLRLDNEIKELQRVYSYSTLQFILADQMKQNTPGL